MSKQTISGSCHWLTGLAGVIAIVALSTLANPSSADQAKPIVQDAKETKLPVQILSMDKSVILKNPGKDSAQLLWGENSPEAQVTITKVTMQPGAVSERHSHPVSEQIWLVEKGEGDMLLADGQTTPIKAGELVRTPPGVVHGIKNTGSVPLEYTSITTPPEDMTKFYKERSK
ncbi:cupin domain-containing protein [Rhizobium rhizogenes]|uniref:cupin domain-containing protein n=1 Tax=Rhizobium rhizogenes TaxID=359 RepID=UPI0015720F12|nr:cupin domain-containing protein [Rhizobium rhizogenes]NTH21839.1 cupin domain-containing protein [Rhizobium rhizogenes]NTH34982.1 cupin domain-containing protein [Rhizobium rhizogenes]